MFAACNESLFLEHVFKPCILLLKLLLLLLLLFLDLEGVMSSNSSSSSSSSSSNFRGVKKSNNWTTNITITTSKLVTQCLALLWDLFSLA
jgi:hypothetical protein